MLAIIGQLKSFKPAADRLSQDLKNIIVALRLLLSFDVDV